MELDDCAFPLLAGLELSDDPDTAFGAANVALLVGSRPRTKGMERQDLLEANGAIFTGQGRSLNDHAADDLRVLVVGNPANTNCLIAMNSAPDVPDERFTAMMRLDHNRARTQVAQKLGTSVNDVSRMTIWGNHSATQYPDLVHCEVPGGTAAEVIGDQAWLRASSSRPCSSVGRPSSRPVGPPVPLRRPTPPSTTCTTGWREHLTATGCPWEFRPMAATACRRACSQGSR